MPDDKTVEIKPLDGLGRMVVEVFENGEPKKVKLALPEVMFAKDVTLEVVIQSLMDEIDILQTTVAEQNKIIETFKADIETRIVQFIQAFTLGGTTHE